MLTVTAFTPEFKKQPLEFAGLPAKCSRASAQLSCRSRPQAGPCHTSVAVSASFPYFSMCLICLLLSPKQFYPNFASSLWCFGGNEGALDGLDSITIKRNVGPGPQNRCCPEETGLPLYVLFLTVTRPTKHTNACEVQAAGVK